MSDPGGPEGIVCNEDVRYGAESFFELVVRLSGLMVGPGVERDPG